MVGVARSQGCRNCRRKKKGCDLQKPTCGQCARLNVPCGWDEKKWTFVQQQEPASSSSASIRSRSNDTLQQLTRSAPPTGWEGRSLNRTAFELASENEFWTLYSPRDDSDTPFISDIYAAPWTRTLREIAGSDDTTKIALNAIVTNIVGRSHSDIGLVQESTRLYARALSNTNKALQDPIKAQSDAVLACCKILSVYENFRIEPSGGISSQGADWHKHVEGTCRIVELRGPAKHVSEHGHALFEDARLLAVIAGMTRRKSNFFTETAWHTIPWTSSPRSLHDKLVDVMITLPRLLQSQDDLTQILESIETDKDRFEGLTEGQKHLARCIRIEESLREWERTAVQICLEQSVNPATNFTGPVTLLDVCKNHGYGFFNVCMQFWVATLLLYATTWISYRKVMLAIQPDQIPSLPTWMRLPDIPEWMNPRPLASNIAACAPHYFSPNAGFWGAQCASLPVGAALHYYAATGGSDSEEMAQLRRLFDQANLGEVTSNFLKSIANTGNSAQGDPSKSQDHQRMATSWYGVDGIRRSSSSSTEQL